MPSRKKKTETPPVADPTPPGGMRFTHTRLLVADIHACYKFYHEVLGFKPRFDGEGSVYAEFDFGGHALALFSRELMSKVTGLGSSVSRATACDTVLLAIEVADVDLAYNELKAKGVEFLNAPHDQPDWLIRVAHFRDPDGNLVEINAPMKESPAATEQT